MPIGLTAGGMLDASEIGDGSNHSSITRTAVNTDATHARMRHRGLNTRPLGKSSRMKSSPPAGNIRARVQVPSHAIQLAAGRAWEAVRPRMAYSAAVARTASRTPQARKSQPIGLRRRRETRTAPTVTTLSGTIKSGPKLLL